MATKKQRERRLAAIEGELEQATDSDTATGWTVKWREADPEARPDGMAVDREERPILKPTTKTFPALRATALPTSSTRT